MTKEEMRIAIAKSLNKCIGSFMEDQDGNYCQICGTYQASHEVVPNYSDGLNAMHEVEESLQNSFEGSSAYEHFLRNVVYKTKHSGVGIGFATLNATAAQRAEAYLRMKGLYKD